MKMKLMIIGALLLCNGLQAQEAGSMEFLHEATSANAIEVAVKTVKGFFKNKANKNIRLALFSKKTGVFALATTCFAACAIINKHFNTNVENSDVTDVTADATTEEDTISPVA